MFGGVHRLVPTGRTRTATCPHCQTRQTLNVVAAERAPIAIDAETLLECPNCMRLSIPAGVAKRLLGAALLIPFAATLLTAVGAALYMLASMLESGFDGGFTLFAVLLIAGCSFPLWKTIKNLRRILTPGALLPLAKEGREGPHRFEGSL